MDCRLDFRDGPETSCSVGLARSDASRALVFCRAALAILTATMMGCSAPVDGSGRAFTEYEGTYRPQQPFMIGRQGELALTLEGRHIYGVLYGKGYRACVVAQPFGHGLSLYPGLPAD